MDNFISVKFFIENLKDDKSRALNQAKELINSDTFNREIVALQKFRFMPKIIKKFQSESLSIEQQFHLIQDAKSNLSDIYLDKLNDYLDNNSGFQNIQKLDVPTRKLFFFAPLTTTDVERSFSVYNDLLTNKRHRLNEESIQKYMICLYNQEINEKTTNIELDFEDSDISSDDEDLMTELSDSN